MKKSVKQASQELNQYKVLAAQACENYIRLQEQLMDAPSDIVEMFEHAVKFGVRFAVNSMESYKLKTKE